jgi:hypothetical protein
MLTGLDIRDRALIDRAVLDLRPGLTALTGETGAGKSILLDALGFALGWKGRGGTLRAGATEGEVTAVFALAPGHPAEAVLAEAGLAASGELILRRTVGADGRTGAWVNDRPAISCNAATGSKRGNSTTLPPAASTAFWTTVCPKLWNRGNVARATVSGPRSISWVRA